MEHAAAVVQSVPDHDDVHEQTPLTHVPPFWHGMAHDGDPGCVGVVLGLHADAATPDGHVHTPVGLAHVAPAIRHGLKMHATSAVLAVWPYTVVGAEARDART
jgi:hypothetical protein